MPCELDPDAPVFTPPSKSTLKSEPSSLSSSPRSSKEPQCSRYSRRSVRQLSLPVSPRPILGTKLPFPRPILGRKEGPVRDEADEYIGREFRNLNRSFQRMRAAVCGLLMLRCTGVVPKPRNPDNHNLSKNIIPDGYLKEIRPPTLQGEPIVVDFTMRVVDINSINVEDMDFRMDMFLKQQWTDARIRIPEEMFEYRDDFITLPSKFFDSLWQPDLYFLSSKVVEIATLTHKFSSVSLYRNKTIRYSARMHAIVACQMEFYHYPMDTQVCPVSVESFSYNNQKMLLRWTEPGVTISPELKLLQYNILQPLQFYQKGALTAEKNGNFSRLVVLLKFERQIGHHLIQTFAPSTLVVVLSWFSFWLDLDAIPARVTLLVTCLLTLVTMFTGLRTDIPAVAYVKALDLWMAGCMVSVFASLGEFVIVKVLQGKYSLLKQKEAERAMATAITPWTNEISINKMGQKAVKYGCLILYWKTDKGKIKITWQEIDRTSRIVFPALFSLFSAVYWTILIVGSRNVNHSSEHSDTGNI